MTAILAKHGLAPDTKDFSISRFLNYAGKFDKDRVLCNTMVVLPKADAAEIEKLHAERDSVNEKRRQADREVVLRASLNGDYDEVMKIVDGLTF